MMNKLFLSLLAAALLSGGHAVNAAAEEAVEQNQLIANQEIANQEQDLTALEGEQVDELMEEGGRDLRMRRYRRRRTARPTARATTRLPTTATTTAPPPTAPPTNAATASGDSSSAFNIDLGYATAITDAQKQGFERAKAKWMSVITKDFASTACVQAGQTFCGYTFQEATCIDDLFIGVKIQPIDGVGNIAGSAGPCAIDAAGKIRIGVMQFDSADANNLIAQGAWDATIMHEMGHVLGIGTLWDSDGLITPKGVSAPYYYLGDNGNAGLDALPNGHGQIIVEDQGGAGTARSHWKEAVYDSELMTGYLEPQGVRMPMSLMTVRSLQDLGYTVDASQADSYSVPASSGRRLRKKIPVGNDILGAPVTTLDDSHIKIKKGREEEFRRDTQKYQQRHNKHH